MKLRGSANQPLFQRYLPGFFLGRVTLQNRNPKISGEPSLKRHNPAVYISRTAVLKVTKSRPKNGWLSLERIVRFRNCPSLARSFMAIFQKSGLRFDALCVGCFLLSIVDMEAGKFTGLLVLSKVERVASCDTHKSTTLLFSTWILPRNILLRHCKMVGFRSNIAFTFGRLETKGDHTKLKLEMPKFSSTP